MTQLSLLTVTARIERPRKRSRQVSRQQFTELRDSGRLKKSQQVFVDALTAHMNRYNVAPTLAELTQWAFKDGRIARNDPNILRPRASELGPGVVKMSGSGVYISGGNQIEFLPIRRCEVTGAMAHPIRPREAGGLPTR